MRSPLPKHLTLVCMTCLELIQRLADLVDLHLRKETEQTASLFADLIMRTLRECLLSLPFSLLVKEE